MDSKYRGREWIEKAYLPSLAGSVLLVGVNEATCHYPKLVRQPDNCVTVDCDPGRAIYGSPAKHIISDFLMLDDTKYDNIAIYGLDGKYTPKDEASWSGWVKKLIRKADKLLNEGGTLLFGGNVEPDWKKIKNMPELRGYEILYFTVDKFGENRTAIKLWLKKRNNAKENTDNFGSL